MKKYVVGLKEQYNVHLKELTWGNFTIICIGDKLQMCA
jgi:hypothetical protein